MSFCIDRKTRKCGAFAVIRHTRAGDVFISAHDGKLVALRQAEGVADDAAAAYGEGSASVFAAEVRLIGKPIDPDEIKTVTCPTCHGNGAIAKVQGKRGKRRDSR